MVSAGQVGSIIISYCLKINGAQQGDELWLIQKKYGAKKEKIQGNMSKRKPDACSDRKWQVSADQKLKRRNGEGAAEIKDGGRRGNASGEHPGECRTAPVVRS